MDYYSNKKHKSIQLCNFEKQWELASYRQDYWQGTFKQFQTSNNKDTKFKYVKSFFYNMAKLTHSASISCEG